MDEKNILNKIYDYFKKYLMERWKMPCLFGWNFWLILVFLNFNLLYFKDQ